VFGPHWDRVAVAVKLSGWPSSIALVADGGQHRSLVRDLILDKNDGGLGERCGEGAGRAGECPRRDHAAIRADRPIPGLEQ
jgi:hypothetical protein